MHVLMFLVFGLIVGFIARALVPGPQSMGLLGTCALGVAGSLIGGLLGTLFTGHRWDEPVAAGWLGSIIGGIVLLIIMKAIGMGRSARV